MLAMKAIICYERALCAQLFAAAFFSALAAIYPGCLVGLYIRKGYSQDISAPPDLTLSPIGTENPFQSSCSKMPLPGYLDAWRQLTNIPANPNLMLSRGLLSVVMGKFIQTTGILTTSNVLVSTWEDGLSETRSLYTNALVRHLWAHLW